MVVTWESELVTLGGEETEQYFANVYSSYQKCVNFASSYLLQQCRVQNGWKDYITFLQPSKICGIDFITVSIRSYFQHLNNRNHCQEMAGKKKK